jgi:hypothetical protein
MLNCKNWVRVIGFFMVTALSTPVDAQVATARVTLVNGIREQINHAKIRLLPWTPDGYLLLRKPTAGHLYVRISEIQLASFQADGNAVSVSIQLESGMKLEGGMMSGAFQIAGQASKGQVEYTPEQIRTLELLDFRAERFIAGPQGATMPRNRFAYFERSYLRYERNGPWVISLDNASSVAEGIGFYDCYDAMVIRNRVLYLGQSQRECAVMLGMDVSARGMSRKVSLDDIEYLEITGKALGDKPELIIKRKDGEMSTVILECLFAGKAMFDNDDELVFWRPFGWEGVPLLPLRKIQIQRKKP